MTRHTGERQEQDGERSSDLAAIRAWRRLADHCHSILLQRESGRRERALPPSMLRPVAFDDEPDTDLQTVVLRPVDESEDLW